MNYKIYADNGYGYKKITDCKENGIIPALDVLILEQDKTRKVIVLEDDYGNNIENVFYHYLGNKTEYIGFREIILNENVRRRKK